MISCDFCGKRERDVWHMVANMDEELGTKMAAICDGCIKVAADVSASHPNPRDVERALAELL